MSERVGCGARRGAVAVACAVLVAGLSGCGALRSVGANAHDAPPVSASPGSPSAAPEVKGDNRKPQPTPGRVILGSFLAINGMTQAQSLALRRSQLGRNPRILQWYYEWTDPLPTSFPGLPAGTIPVLTWRGTTYSSILDGSQDGLIIREAQRLATYGKPVFLRWAWEMNGSWYQWGGSKNGNRPDLFVLAWRHVHDLFVGHGANNVAWVWAPNWYSLPNAPWNVLTNYYPGDAYVDWVGISGYGDTGLTPSKLYDSFYQTYAGKKPIMLAETGVMDRGGTTKPDWIEALREWVKARPAVAAVCWYDTDHSPGTSENFRIDSSPQALAAFKVMADDPYFSG